MPVHSEVDSAAGTAVAGEAALDSAATDSERMRLQSQVASCLQGIMTARRGIRSPGTLTRVMTPADGQPRTGANPRFIVSHRQVSDTASVWRPRAACPPVQTPVATKYRDQWHASSEVDRYPIFVSATTRPANDYA